jgi:hypothetical protein
VDRQIQIDLNQIMQYSEQPKSSAQTEVHCAERAALRCSGVILRTISPILAIFSISWTGRVEMERSLCANSINTGYSRSVRTESPVWK